MRPLTVYAGATFAVIALSGTANAQQRQGGGQSQGMDMNAFMARCAQVRQQVRPGAPQSASLRQTLDQCDQMDRSMGMTPPVRR